MPSENKYASKYITTQELNRRIKEQNQALVIYANKVYRLDKWLKFHPGGELAIKHMIGKDATDAINAFHPDYVKKKNIHTFYIGEYVDEDACIPSAEADRATLDNTPVNNIAKPILSAITSSITSSITPSTTSTRRISSTSPPTQSSDAKLDLIHQERITEAYRKLDARIRSKGLYNTRYINYMYEVMRFGTLYALTWYFALTGTSTLHYLMSAVCLGAFWHQIAFTAHDAGHNGITHLLPVDGIIGVMTADLCGGLSMAWWKKSHYVHHLVTNEIEHDPDLQQLPFFAVSTKFVQSIYSTYYERVLDFDRAAQFFIQFQHLLYYPVLAFGRFNLYFLSISHILKEQRVAFRKLELFSMGLYWMWFSYLLSRLPYSLIIPYILISHMITVLLHVQITLSHYGMSTEELGPKEAFAAKMLRTSMDVDCPKWLDWLHGGLQFQAIHHLFPRVPRHNLRECQRYVKEFCKEVGIEYHCYGFVKGNGIVLEALRDVANQISLMNKVAKGIVEKELREHVN
ncbi:7689_t:CDS:1 [Paraglomus brasilianum]|uniref:7689_t:CDS:1 n=1 Tax=Paraglomus brasilianum TaxID=144538 RepID=A0A9N8ZFZ3_9GLOM|nr:7689_t:CDS:1 [Paraglomus brasilianum]